jgi:dTDP-4-amino-4,6-dideoxygalactose transaminase
MRAYEYLSYSKEDFPIASNYENKILSLPIFPEMTEEQIIYVCSCIKSFYLG